MQIRKSTEADFETILNIYNQAIPTHQITADLELATPINRRAWFDFHLTSEQYPIWTVEDENGIAGWFSFSPFYERPAFVHTSEISIYLDSSAKGKGYGSKIIEFMQTEMLKHNIHTLMAYVFELNQVSQNLMRKHGFEQWGRFPHIANMGKDEQGQDKWRTLLMMSYQKGIE
ncbi:sortase [Actinobacillus pleuropneumoniae]|uniref:Predicted sortase and related acyltransferases n=1 Tax=Actinobacillus pleuropneumoniae serotype 5b (strain L20) TaxID=416269 RepID=A3MZI1_ACTP2|nr:GNAT family N-acetyltransferase [Actinobacillus pleuropneumoniae]ABN73567.1 predicted sortase and related acyltransferases [Actinobacillus pleuropneumoniae serovar 5b str. L20]MEE3683347.1 N-acetyltransferase family protein [Actinobacillus pleuropneumoniae]QSZ38452.1 sortase [Actinobacillus pleuropneumoniae]UKH11326.1 N-acetyltransferase [Actinobacillus pleuropneumoniae]UPK79253.1 N-acetyltransferase [Actinobacillus pleuropneumoniae]